MKRERQPDGSGPAARVFVANCRRVDRYWLVSLPELDHSIQLKRLEQVRPAAAELLASAFSLKPSMIEVDLQPDLDPGTALAVEQARDCAVLAQQATAELGRANRHAVALLLGNGLSLRDAAALMYLSPQRIHQLSKGSS